MPEFELTFFQNESLKGLAENFPKECAAGLNATWKRLGDKFIGEIRSRFLMQSDTHSLGIGRRPIRPSYRIPVSEALRKRVDFKVSYHGRFGGYMRLFFLGNKREHEGSEYIAFFNDQGHDVSQKRLRSTFSIAKRTSRGLGRVQGKGFMQLAFNQLEPDWETATENAIADAVERI